MRPLRSALGIGALVLALSGCIKNNQSSTTQNNEYQVISGKPISVAQSFGRFHGTLATVIETTDGKKVLAYSRYVYSDSGSEANTKDYAKGMALIESEIYDGDKEQIKLRGRYVADGFEVTSIEANGYHVDF